VLYVDALTVVIDDRLKVQKKQFFAGTSAEIREIIGPNGESRTVIRLVKNRARDEKSGRFWDDFV